MAGNTRDPGQSVTARALAVLNAFDTTHPRLTLSDMARRAGLPLATVHRLARELEAWRALDRDEQGYYHVGLRLWEIGLLAPVATRLREIAMPFMQDLYEVTRENIHLAIRDGFDVLYVEKLTGHRSVPIISRSGGRLPMHATGVGKALLAHQSDEFIQAFCERPLERPTRYTIVERGRLLRELALVRNRGYATTSEEMTLGSYSVAVPILDESGTSTAALGIVVHSVRADAAKLAPPLRTAARGIERRLTESADDPYPSLVHDLPKFDQNPRAG
jgi:DNA-binding IclR family transcriptional regulator